MITSVPATANMRRTADTILRELPNTNRMPPDTTMESSSRELLDQFECLRQNVFTLYDVANVQEKRVKGQWEEDRSVMKSYIEMLGVTRDVMLSERKRILDRLAEKSGNGSEAIASDKQEQPQQKDGADIEERLAYLRERDAAFRKEMQDVRDQMNSLYKDMEREIWETKLEVLQDTRRLMLDEIRALEDKLARRQKTERRRKAREDGLATLGKLQGQITKAETKLDKAKRNFYFPSANGYRFRAGASGIYVGAKDLHVSEISAGFLLAAAKECRASGRTVGSMKLHLGSAATPVRNTVKKPASPAEGPPSDAVPEKATQRTPEEPHFGTAKVRRTHAVVSGDSAALKSSTNSGEPTDEPGSGTDVTGDAQTAPSESEKREDASDVFNDVPADVSVEQIRGETSKAKRFAVRFLNKIASGDKFRRKPKTRTSSEIPNAEVTEDRQPPRLVKKFLQTVGQGVGGESLKSQFTSRLKVKSRQERRQSLEQEEEVTTEVELAVIDSDAHAQIDSKVKEDHVQTDNTLNKIKEESELPDPGTEVDMSPTKGSQTSDSQSNDDDHQDEDTSPDNSAALDLDSKANASDSAMSTIQSELDEGVVGQHPSKPADVNFSDRRKRMDSTIDSEGWFDHIEKNEPPTARALSSGRRGAYVKLQAENLELVGEKGTRVPNFVVGEIMLELECVLSVDLEYSAVGGWEAVGGLKFEVIQLKKHVVRSSLPLPVSLIRKLLNMILPKIVERSLVSTLPVEFGEFILESSSDCLIDGELTVAGPSLAVVHADLSTKQPNPVNTTPNNAANVKQIRAVQEAKAILGLSDIQAEALGALFGGKWMLVDSNVACSIAGLCALHRRLSESEVWPSLCDLWTRALDIVLKVKGLEGSLDFGHLMNDVVAGLAAKPMRVLCQLTRLNCNLNVDNMIWCIRDYCERSAKDLTGTPNSGPGPGVSLNDQLDALEAWYSYTSSHLSTFKSKFKTATMAIITNGDAQKVQFGLDRLHYEGPLSIKVPIGSHDDHTLAFNITVPYGPRNAAASVFEAFKQAFTSLRNFHCEEASGNDHSESIASLQEALGGRRTSETGNAADVVQEIKWVMGDSDLADDQGGAPRRPLGKVFVHKLSVGMSLHEENLAKFLLGDHGENIESSSTPCLSPIGLKQMLACVGNMAFTNLEPRHRFVDDVEDAKPYMLSLESGEFTRLRVDVDSVGFQSFVSPAALASMCHIFIHEALTAWPEDNQKHIQFADRAFQQLIQYINRRSLDLLICTRLDANIKDDRLFISLKEMPDNEGVMQTPLRVVNDVDLAALIDSFCMTDNLTQSLSLG